MDLPVDRPEPITDSFLRMLRRLRLRLVGVFGRTTLLLILVSLFTDYAVSAAASDPGSEFEKGNRLYEEGKFTEAAAAYQSVLKTGQTSPALYFNLGNAYFKAGQLGQAIVAYRRAQRSGPRDPDVLANLQFAREQSRGPRIRPALWQALLARVSLTEWTVAASAGLWAVLATLTLIQLKPALARPLRGTTLVLGSVTVAVCLGLGAVWISARSTRIAVVVVPQSEVRHGPLKESQPAFTAYDGAELQILDRKDEWLKVTAGPNRTGWLPAADVLAL